MVALSVVLTGCDKPNAPAEKQAQQVGIVTLKARRFEQTVELPGRTTALRVAEVRPQVDGIILKRLFEEGHDVKAGQVLYQIDPATYQATLKSAEATLASARAKAKRYELLVANQAVSRQDYEAARAASLEAEAAADQARINLRYSKITAPISGRIGRSTITEGALVTNGQSTALATIKQYDPIYVDVTQSVKDQLALRTAIAVGELDKAGKNQAEARLILPDGSQYQHTGTLQFSEVSVDETTGSVTLRAVFPNPDHMLLPGMFVHTKLISGVRKQAILAPQQGITRDHKGEPVALLVDADNKVVLRSITTHSTSGSNWLVTAGLKDGDRLITEGLQYVLPGDTVSPVAAQNIKGMSDPEPEAEIETEVDPATIPANAAEPQ
ncbi:efflux RND transporter periplasmic adaptor subunit [Pseudomonas sp. M30-35]|uniref:efflux RND transporter periplasmic adaptor subunit n=1 Tax=Pseudomonas sp. M30-35 TaxID=1981174 RepID=UPI000B3CAB46|nr:efflux RND transporter periplasmic adaptor subunit [Pseudomonas sp. M30-35]ARU86883.1 efflux transporter periplasmic adaptor subunit [Pseudomonas sp. M30-35]